MLVGLLPWVCFFFWAIDIAMAYYVMSDDNLPFGVGRPGPPLNFCPWPMFRESLRRTGDENPQHKGSLYMYIQTYDVGKFMNSIIVHDIYMHHWSSHPMIQSKPSQLTFVFSAQVGLLPRPTPVRVRTLDTGGAGPVSGLLEAVRMVKDGLELWWVG